MNEPHQDTSRVPKPCPAQNYRRVSSHDLFQKESIIEIDHEGAIYRLQITRQGKLILTK